MNSKISAAAKETNSERTCRICTHGLGAPMLDLGTQPLSNALLSARAAFEPEMTYPLKLYRCDQCGLVQLPAQATREDIFEEEYLYLSGYSKSWQAHCAKFAAEMKARLSLVDGVRERREGSAIYEIASNDGTLLKEFQKLGLRNVWGIEPAKNVAAIAQRNGVPTIDEFFGAALVEHAGWRQADLIVANNVLAHVPDLHDFVRGLKLLLAPAGCISIEVPWLVNLIEQCQWDTIYHEHFSYFSIGVLEQLFQKHDLVIVAAEELPTHGGSVRLLLAHSVPLLGQQNVGLNDWRAMVAFNGTLSGVRQCDGVRYAVEREKSAGITDGSALLTLQTEVDLMKNALLEFLIDQRKHGRSVLGFGAAAKGNTLLNYAGVRRDLLPLIADDNPLKQGRFTPGMQIPIGTVDELIAAKPDYVLVLPWNVGADARERLKPLTDAGATLISPRLEVM